MPPMWMCVCCEWLLYYYDFYIYFRDMCAQIRSRHLVCLTSSSQRVADVIEVFLGYADRNENKTCGTLVFFRSFYFFRIFLFCTWVFVLEDCGYDSFSCFMFDFKWRERRNAVTDFDAEIVVWPRVYILCWNMVYCVVIQYNVWL